MMSSYVPRAHYLYSLKHTPFYDFTEDGIVPLKSGYLDYNTKYKDATRLTLRETSSSAFSSSHISSFFISNFFFFSCLLWELELFCYYSSLLNKMATEECLILF